MSESPSTFATVLGRLRRDRGLSLEALSRRTGYARTYLWELERGLKSNPSDALVADLDQHLAAGGELIAAALMGSDCEAHQGPMFSVADVATAAARESTRTAAGHGSRQVAPSTVDQVRSDIARLAVGFSELAPLDTLLEARRVRDLATELVDCTRRPAQVAELYLTAGLACGLLSVASFDVGHWAAAEEQARSAYVYADLVDHWSLRAWARGQQALVAVWGGRPGDAAELAHSGMELAPPGTPRARLASIAARAWSQLGAAEEVRARLADADRERERVGAVGSDELHDGLGGQFGWGPGRHAMCAAASLLRAGNPARAADEASLAIRLWPDDRSGTQVDLKASADLASAMITLGHLDAADAALERVWSVPPDRRRHALTARLGQVAQQLEAPSYRSAVEARELRERIAEFSSRPSPPMLPGVRPPS